MVPDIGSDVTDSVTIEPGKEYTIWCRAYHNTRLNMVPTLKIVSVKDIEDYHRDNISKQ
jgi:hypothetical protein